MDNTISLQEIARAQSQGKTVVFTNGCFDILHVGHVEYLNEAKKLGDLLVIGLNSDSSIKKLKGEKRPIVPENERRELLLNLKCCDFVLLFSEETPLELIKKVCPNILVKGGDWPIEKIVCSQFVNERGGKTLSLPFIEGHSTTNIIDKIISVYTKE